MNASTELRQRLKTLSIPKEQRPTAAATYGEPAVRRGPRVGTFVFLLVLVGLAGGGYFAWQRYGAQIMTAIPVQTQAVDVRTQRVTAKRESEVTAVLTATGKIVSDHRVQVVTKVSGQIVALYFEQGDRVAQGQKLAQIEDTLYRARRDQAAAMLVRSQATLAFERVNYKRISELFASQRASEIEHAEAKRKLEEAEALVNADTAALEWAQKALTDTDVVAPIAGVVLERNVEVGDFVAAEGGRGANANAQFAAIADMSKLRVEVDISELDVGRIRRGMPCLVAPDAYKDRKYDGVVLWVDPGANYAKATVQAKVRIVNPDDFLRVEGSAQVSFLADRSASAPGAPERAAIWIPAAAVRTNPQTSESTVFVVADGVLKETPVRLGQKAGAQVEIVAGLSDGERIAAEGADKLRGGQHIK